MWHGTCRSNLKFDTVLEDEDLCEKFQQHLMKEFSVQHLLFYKHVKEYENTFAEYTPSEAWEVVNVIYGEYIADEAYYQVNVLCECRSAYHSLA